jgi:AcrR family transcriptional regulator
VSGVEVDDSRPAGTRARIQAAALDLFVERGFSRTSLQQIADRLGITKAAILYHFPSKDHILAGLAEPLVHELEGVLDRAEHLPWPERRWVVVEGWLDGLMRHRQSLSMLMYDFGLLARMPAFSRFLTLAPRAHQLVAEPGSGRAGRIRAVQVVAMIGDPTVFFSEVPPEELREEILAGVRVLLGRRGAPRRRPAGTVPEQPTVDLPARSHETAVVVDVAGHAPGAGRRAGRPRRMSPDLIATARRMLEGGERSVPEVAAALGVSRATLYRYLRVSEPGSETVLTQ